MNYLHGGNSLLFIDDDVMMMIGWYDNDDDDDDGNFSYTYVHNSKVYAALCYYLCRRQ